jgi:ribose transport system permease protein
MIAFSITTDTFWGIDSWGNVANIILQQAPFLILMTLSMTLTVILGGIDLAVGSILSVTSCTVALLLQTTGNILLSVVTGLVMGLAFGMLSGTLVAYVRINPFIATYAVYWITKGLAYVVVGGKQIYDFGVDSFRSFFLSNDFIFLGIALFIVAAVGIMLSKTNLGKHIYCTGSNIEAAEMSGINTKRVLVTGYALAGLITAMTGVMYIANLGSADPYIGDPFAIRAISAALIGGASFNGGEGGVYNVITGALIVVVLYNGLVHWGVPGVWQEVVIGSVIIFSIILERVLNKALGKAQ